MTVRSSTCSHLPFRYAILGDSLSPPGTGGTGEAGSPWQPARGQGTGDAMTSWRLMMEMTKKRTRQRRPEAKLWFATKRVQSRTTAKCQPGRIRQCLGFGEGEATDGVLAVGGKSSQRWHLSGPVERATRATRATRGRSGVFGVGCLEPDLALDRGLTNSRSLQCI